MCPRKSSWKDTLDDRTVSGHEFILVDGRHLLFVDNPAASDHDVADHVRSSLDQQVVDAIGEALALY